ncbi:protein D3 isoform X3 [Bemisia tabaci]|uniref:protein D3 isoform X3 n=1 Tax=Bemisia tabaci TaxID=7038 RepID=UPI003B27BCFB
MSKILFPFNHSPEFGNEMNLSLHTHIDWAQWPGTLNDTYTLIYTIPDVPSRESPTSGEYQVWIVGNIEGPIYIQNETLTEYVKPTHPNGTDHWIREDTIFLREPLQRNTILESQQLGIFFLLTKE